MFKKKIISLPQHLWMFEKKIISLPQLQLLEYLLLQFYLEKKINNNNWDLPSNLMKILFTYIIFLDKFDICKCNL